MAEVVQLPARRRGEIDPLEARSLVVETVLANLIITLIRRGALEAGAVAELLERVNDYYQSVAEHQRANHPASAAMWSATSRAVVGNLLGAVQAAAEQAGGEA